MSFWKDFLIFNKGKGKKTNELSEEYAKCVKLMTWNVLARSPTKYFHKEHSYLPLGEEGISEHIEQTMNRYKIILEEIKKMDADVLFLQEMDYNLYYYLKKHINGRYKIFFNSVADSRTKDQSNSFGTGILWKKQRFVLRKSYEINSNTDKYSWKNSNTTLLYDKISDKTFYCISIHLSGSNMDSNLLLLNDTFKKINKKYPFIIAGDLNCRYHLSDCLKKYYMLNDLNTYKFKKNDISTCSFDFFKKVKDKKALIDSILFNSKIQGITYKIEKHSCKTKLYEKKDKKIYSNINYGSDHFWIKGLIQFL